MAILSSALVNDNYFKMGNIGATKDWSSYYCKREGKKLLYTAPVCTVHISVKPILGMVRRTPIK